MNKDALKPPLLIKKIKRIFDHNKKTQEKRKPKRQPGISVELETPNIRDSSGRDLVVGTVNRGLPSKAPAGA